jgi:hypothetical protein
VLLHARARYLLFSRRPRVSLLRGNPRAPLRLTTSRTHLPHHSQATRPTATSLTNTAPPTPFCIRPRLPPLPWRSGVRPKLTNMLAPSSPLPGQFSSGAAQTTLTRNPNPGDLPRASPPIPPTTPPHSLTRTRALLADSRPPPPATRGHLFAVARP